MDGTTRNLVGIPINQPGFHGKEIVWCFPLLNYWTLPSPTLTQEVKEVPFAELSQGEDYIRVKVWPLSPWINGGAWGMGLGRDAVKILCPWGKYTSQLFILKMVGEKHPANAQIVSGWKNYLNESWLQSFIIYPGTNPESHQKEIGQRWAMRNSLVV